MAKHPPEPSLPWGEFELIDKLFAPLSRGLPGAFDLKDDVATLSVKQDHELVLKADSLIEGVHFLRADPAGSVAQKALRRALSDLAAKGVEAHAYLLAIAFPDWVGGVWAEGFADGLSRDQTQFGIALAGGETNRTPGPLTITITAVGWVRTSNLVRRSGARQGDGVWVTGTFGDAAAGLSLSRNELACSDESVRDYLVARYRIPEPRLAFGKSLHSVASAAIDVSDGLIADLAHVAEASHVRIEIDLGSVPVSRELRALWGDGPGTTLRAVSAGDDYEIAFSAPSSAASDIGAAARRTSTLVTRIGQIGRSVDASAAVALFDPSGAEVTLSHKGYTHF